MKKHQRKLQWEEIAQHFLFNYSHQSGIVAYFIYKDDLDNKTIHIRYLNEEDFSNIGTG